MSRQRRSLDSSAADLEAALGPAPEPPSRPEVVVLRVRRHGRHLTVPVVLLFAIAAATGYWVGSFAQPLANVAAGIAAILLSILLVFLPILTWLAERTTITTRRVIMRRGFFVRHRLEISLSRVSEVRTRRTVGQRMHGSGDIDLCVGPDRTTVADVPGMTRVAEAVQELVARTAAPPQRF